MGSIAAGKIARGDSSTNIPQPKQLIFELDDKAKKYIKTSEKNFEQLIGSHELEVRFQHKPLRTRSQSSRCYITKAWARLPARDTRSLQTQRLS